MRARPVRVAVDPALRDSAAEISYVFRTLLRTAGYAWHLEWAGSSAEAVDIAYGDAAWHRATVRIPAVRWPFAEASLRDCAGVHVAHDVPLLVFEGETPRDVAAGSTPLEFPSDLVFSSIWWLTGAREPAFPRSGRDDLDLRDSAIVRHALLRRPGVSLVAALLRRHFEKAGRPARRPEWAASGAAAFCLTHDVDYPEIIRWIEVPRVLASRGMRGLSLARDVAAGKSHFWTFGEWMDFAESLGTRATFYFMARKGSLLQYALGTPDDFYDIGSPRFRELFAELRERGCEIGLHASYRAYESVARLTRERERIEQVAQVSGIGNRHHYWHLDPNDPNETLRRHEAAGLLYDSSLGLEYYPGFRRGICHPFRVFHAGARKELDVVQLPPAWMDDHFDRRLAQNRIVDPDGTAAKLLEATRATGGVAIVDYHSRGMNADFYPRYGPWLMRFAQSHLDSSLSYRTPLEIHAAYVAYERDLTARSIDGLHDALAPEVIRSAPAPALPQRE